MATDEAARSARRARLRRAQAVHPRHANGLAATLQLAIAEVGQREPARDERPGLGADVDLARRCERLEPRRHVHHVTQWPARPVSLQVTRDDDPAVDAAVHLERVPGPSLEGGPQVVDRGVELERGAHRADCVVLVGDGVAEHREDGVTHELVDAPAVAGHDLSRLVVDEVHQLADDLGIDRLGHLRVPRRIREEHRDETAFGLRMRRRLVSGEGIPAAVAEARPGRVGSAAPRTREVRHGRDRLTEEPTADEGGGSAVDPSQSRPGSPWLSLARSRRQ